ncbi:L-gulonolactone oxidase 3 isoform X2 [Nymphaea colorata]|uniref:L-gulonolactone oxidase 3 isoform X2 n=1 Tax=Nymphaea colorata TaxID=210225 RepID=UPI00214F0461|nr:L-gulonolactone oxidase 3 isoform X2 [Nymphaea colorata]
MLVMRSFLVLTYFFAAHALPPPSPVRCNDSGCTITNSYGVWGDRKDCAASAVVYPTTEEELRLAVAEAVKNQFKVKTVSGTSHTMPKFACPGYAGEKSMLISTAKLNNGIEVDAAAMTVIADAGVGLRDLIDSVEEEGLSLVASPYWDGVSLGGLISTGAHGSSWWGKGGAVHDHVVMLSLEPAFKRSITNYFKSDSQFEEIFTDHARQHEFADITWYPSQHVAVFRADDRVPINSSGDGRNDFLGFQPQNIVVSASVRASEKALESSRDIKGKCTMAAGVVAFKKLVANGLKNNKLIFTGYPVVGQQGKMQASGSCARSSSADILTTCAWDPRIKGLLFYETTAIFPASKFQDFIKDVKTLRNLKPENFCGVDLYNGFLIRFIKASEAYLGQPQDSVVVDFNYYRADDASIPRLNQDVWEEVEQMAFFKYAAKPHWAKNRNVAFMDVKNKYPNFDKFIALKEQLDPRNTFSSKESDALLNGTKELKSNGCALEGLCICSEDRHCSPEEGYFCRPGLVYREARVCRYIMSSVA